MGVDYFTVEWTRDLGNGRLLVMEGGLASYRAVLAGFHGVGPTQEAALDALLARMQDYNTTSDDLARSLSPGGHLHEQLRQIEHLVDQIAPRSS